ncbi:MAG: signal peptide peptidase SppA [Isosphaeraceae bacterium]|nr:signal peptide peptidase SppA [Isosphaeraceae bacterium]
MRPRIALSVAVISVFSIVATLRAEDASKTVQSAATPAPIVVDLAIKGSLSEAPLSIGFDGKTIGENLQGLVERLSKAKADPAVKGLVLRIRSLSAGRAKIEDLRRAVLDFRSSGKPVHALLEAPGNAEYLLAAAADEIVMAESDTLMLKGLAAEVTFYKGLFDKLGIVADWMQVGKFKSYGEPYTRTSMSPAFRQEMTELLSDSYAQMAEMIAARQGIDVDAAKTLIDGGPYTAASAKAAGLISRIAYADQVEAELKRSLGLPKLVLEKKYGKSTEKVDYSGFAGFMRMMSALSGDAPKKAASKAPKVALIHASGSIMTGKSSGAGLLGEATMGSDTIIEALRKAEADATVKAIVLRVDSPGGSALASDLIWREVVRIEKPIVASMSDVAASGGYYISMGCDKVYAQSSTITGSIGVTGGKIVVGGLLEKAGVTTDTIHVGKNGTLLSPFSRFSEAEKSAMQKMMDETYRQFVTKAAAGRKRSFDDVEKHAGGRVYTGRQAKALGLVDEVGSLADALASARELGGISSEKESEILVLPEPQGLLESLLGPLEGLDGLGAELGIVAPDAAIAALRRVRLIQSLLEREPVLVIMPFDIRIE